MGKKKIISVLAWFMGLQMLLMESTWAKSVKQALNDTANEGVSIGDAFLAVVLVGCGFGIAFSKTRAATLKHLPFIALGAYLIYNATSVVSWFRGFLS